VVEGADGIGVGLREGVEYGGDAGWVCGGFFRGHDFVLRQHRALESQKTVPLFLLCVRRIVLFYISDDEGR